FSVRHDTKGLCTTAHPCAFSAARRHNGGHRSPPPDRSSPCPLNSPRFPRTGNERWPWSLIRMTWSTGRPVRWPPGPPAARRSAICWCPAARPGSPGWRREADRRRGAGLVGVSPVESLQHRAGVIEPTPRWRRDIAREIRRRRPELVVTLNRRDNWGPGTWNTPDHRATGTAVLDAVADAG